jgi:hypothetical protein
MDAQQPAPAIAGRVVLSPGMPSKFLLNFMLSRIVAAAQLENQLILL